MAFGGWGGGGIQKPSYFEGKSHMLPYLGNEFLLVAIIKQDSSNFLLYYLTSNQIWFIPLVKYHQSTNLTKLKKRKKILVAMLLSLKLIIKHKS
jgi:hypothetical protein